jgi:hypothetical protein
MKKHSKSIFKTVLLILSISITGDLLAARTKSYTKKPAYSGFGRPSKVNRLPRTKSTSGHYKRSNRGYTYVNPYYRSK